MRILFINDYGYEVGGAETYLLNLKKGLEKNGHTVKILSSDRKGPKKPFSDYTFKGINQDSVGRVFPYMWNVHALLTLKNVLKEFNPDIVHLHFVFYHASPSIFLALKNIPTIYTAHAHELIGPMGVKRTKRCTHPEEESCIYCLGIAKYLPERIKMIAFSLLKKSIDYYVSPSKHHLKLIQEYGYYPSMNIYNGINLFPYSEITNTKTILYIGRLSQDKGVINAVAAMKDIVKKIPDARLIIVGSGPEERSLKKYAKDNNLEKNIIFTGKIDNTHVEEYYKKSTLLLVPSTHPDNLPTVCIEAMSVGRPIIGSNIGGIPELITDGDTGFLVEPGNAQAIATQAIKILSNPELIKDMSQNALHKSSQFEITTHIEKIEKLYKKILQEK